MAYTPHLQVSTFSGHSEPCSICDNDRDTVVLSQGSPSGPIGRFVLCGNHAEALARGTQGFSALVEHHFGWEDSQIQELLQRLLQL